MSKTRPVARSAKVESAPKSSISFLPLLLSAAAIIFGMYRAIELRWISDDAFITMRYVKNFLEGNGLVYNVGERVEGYTHFLWLLLLSAAGAIGFDPVDASQWLGIASYAGLLVLLLLASYRNHKKSAIGIWLPVAAFIFALNYDNAEWASGGLETSFYTLLIVAAFYVWFFSKYSERVRLLLTGTLLAFVSLTRPDGVLFTFSAVLFLFFRSRRNIRSAVVQIALTLLPSIVIGVPYLAWKYFYYGDLLPLTYYAKSGGSDYWSQGFYYIWLFFRVHYVLGLSVASSGVAFVLQWRESQFGSFERGSPVFAAWSVSVVYLILFVAKSGGDFMFARFLMPVLPFLYFCIESAVNTITSSFPRRRIAIAILLGGALFVEDRIPGIPYFTMQDGKRQEDWDHVVKEGALNWIGDERWFYYDHMDEANSGWSWMQMYSEAGKFYARLFRGLPVTIAVPGAMNMLAYYASFPKVIDEYGLTDSAIAHAPVSIHGHIGHEKHVSEEYLRNNHVDLQIGKIVFSMPQEMDFSEIAFDIPSISAWQKTRLITYDSAFVNELRRRLYYFGNDTRVLTYEEAYNKNLPAFIDQVLPNYPPSQLDTLYDRIRQLYFSKFPDSALEHRFEAKIEEIKARTK